MIICFHSGVYVLRYGISKIQTVSVVLVYLRAKCQYFSFGKVSNVTHNFTLSFIKLRIINLAVAGIATAHNCRIDAVINENGKRSINIFCQVKKTIYFRLCHAAMISALTPIIRSTVCTSFSSCSWSAIVDVAMIICLRSWKCCKMTGTK